MGFELEAKLQSTKRMLQPPKDYGVLAWCSFRFGLGDNLLSEINAALIEAEEDENDDGSPEEAATDCLSQHRPFKRTRLKQAVNLLGALRAVGAEQDGLVAAAAGGHAEHS